MSAWVWKAARWFCLNHPFAAAAITIAAGAYLSFVGWVAWKVLIP